MASEEKTPVVITYPNQAIGGSLQRRLRGMATIEDDDERLLAQIGYKQV